MRVLNVGGGPSRVLPERYSGWSQDLLDIDPAVKPDVCCDAKQMSVLDPQIYDAVYCSHNLEHFHQHEVPVVLAGFMHVLKPGGSVDISVPNVMDAFKQMLGRSLDINDVYYRVPAGPIRFHDVLYGWNAAMSRGNLFYAHKCGFSALSLDETVRSAGFAEVRVAEAGPNLFATGIKPCR